MSGDKRDMEQTYIQPRRSTPLITLAEPLTENAFIANLTSRYSLGLQLGLHDIQWAGCDAGNKAAPRAS